MPSSIRVPRVNSPSGAATPPQTASAPFLDQFVQQRFHRDDGVEAALLVDPAHDGVVAAWVPVPFAPHHRAEGRVL